MVSNGKKSNQFPILLTNNENETKILYINEKSSGTPMVINPSKLDPEKYLTYRLDDSKDDFGIICSVEDNELGNTTIRVIGVYDIFYTKEHREHLFILGDTYMNLLRAKNQKNDTQVDSIKEKFGIWMSSKNKFSALTRSFAEKKNLSRFNIKILKKAETI